jgi:predicted dehydrogenase
LSAQQGVAGANDRVRVGIVGLRGRGENHIRGFGALPNVEIAALCDIDDSVMSQRLAQVRKMGFQPKTYTDVRKLLDDKSIDAVSIATPNHWHALIAIWAMQAGKDVYVEKPCSHNLWEGKQLIRATAKYNRIVQHGTQLRSLPSVINAVEKMQQEAILGDIYLSRPVLQVERHDQPHARIAGTCRSRLQSVDRPGSVAAFYQESFPL